jgi:hypothetical protein
MLLLKSAIPFANDAVRPLQRQLLTSSELSVATQSVRVSFVSCKSKNTLKNVWGGYLERTAIMRMRKCQTTGFISRVKNRWRKRERYWEIKTCTFEQLERLGSCCDAEHSLKKRKGAHRQAHQSRHTLCVWLGTRVNVRN